MMKDVCPCIHSGVERVKTSLQYIADVPCDQKEKTPRLDDDDVDMRRQKEKDGLS